jgi:hypothetical protein
MLCCAAQGYQSILADVATYTGMLTLASMVVSRLVFQYAGWGVAAAVTPAVMGMAGVVFFGATLASQMAGLSPEMAATIAGVGATAGIVTQVGAAGAGAVQGAHRAATALCSAATTTHSYIYAALPTHIDVHKH